MAQVAVENQEHWHSLRAQNVGASEVAALFNASPYTTRFTLWHQKSGKIARPDFDSERMMWGTLLEPVIAQGIAEKQSWTIRKVHRYITHPTVAGMGASLDYEIINHPDGPGCLEIKNVGIDVFKKSWVKNEDGSFEAPLHIELQLQHQLSVTGRAWGAIGFLVGGNEAHVVIRKRHEPTIQKIEATVAEFWESIKAGQVPELEAAGDLEAVTKAFSGALTVNTDSIEFEEAAKRYLACKSVEKKANESTNFAKAVLLDLMDKAGGEVVFGQSYKATFKEQSKAEYVVKASKSRVLRVTELKLKGE